MEAFLLYIFRSTICLTLFLIFFKVLLCRDTFFRWNRFILLGGILFCLVWPFVEFEAEPSPFRQHLNELEKVITGYVPEEEQTAMIYALPTTDTEVLTESKGNIPYTGWIYVGGMGICLLFWLLAYRRMFGILRSGESIPREGYTLVVVSGKICPFSWRNYIVLSRQDYEGYKEIIAHECIHIRKKHTWDLYLIQLLLVFHWFNPAVWLLRRELQDIHEYEADEGVIKQGIDATKYQLLLVKKAVGSRVESIANSFNHSKLKNRITMMLKEKSNRWARLKILLFLPLAVLIAQAFARPEVASSMEKLASFDKVNQIPDKPEKWTEDFFQQTWKEYFGDRVENVKLEKERVLNLYINRKNILLIVNNLLADNVTWDQLADKLAAQLKGMHTRFSPVYIVMMRDKETSDKKWQDLLNIVGEVCDRFTTEVRQQLPGSDRDKMDKKFPVLVNIAKPHITEPYLDPSLVQAPPPPPAYPINLIYKTAEGKAVHLRAVNIEQLGEKLEKEGRPISQGDIELQIKGRLSKDKIVSFLKDKGIQPTLISQETGALPQLTMVFTYNSGLQARRDVWKYENAVSFIDQIRTDKVKNVELEIFEKVRPETIAKVRAYLQSKGITNISEKKILFK
ncbi:M56 family metallopeptidase [Culturomica massiliensis]|uniref:M56 family metallopeptidase n=1 Tax=Culturomica massiliensis TaxID=1841857 RepID=UPI0008382E15|nr:M56 family metallopeptidase [Culturomica massiliensis]